MITLGEIVTHNTVQRMNADIDRHGRWQHGTRKQFAAAFLWLPDDASYMAQYSVKVPHGLAAFNTHRVMSRNATSSRAERVM
jgi:hypothetical protein